ncbi:uncharacterized protein LOC116344576 [Contarinia nasturtii]|uniref:uncharacterized protein LOC116344576 n=1 Tax=Contarinia nasturtii TaxID=265458 RepID=UPI0012D3FD44|nr:uncharacterized protein LOC116344576 [Contarinia nasturtii]
MEPNMTKKKGGHGEGSKERPLGSALSKSGASASQAQVLMTSSSSSGVGGGSYSSLTDPKATSNLITPGGSEATGSEVMGEILINQPPASSSATSGQNLPGSLGKTLGDGGKKKKKKKKGVKTPAESHSATIIRRERRVRNKARENMEKSTVTTGLCSNSMPELSGTPQSSSTPTRAGPSVGTSRALGRVQQQSLPDPSSASKKRPRPQEGTPPELNAHKRLDVKETPENVASGKPTYAQALVGSSLEMAVVHSVGQDSLSEISHDLFTQILKTLNVIMVEDVRAGSQAPTFESTTRTRGVVKIVCDDKRSSEWLMGVAGRLATKLELPLIVCEFSKIPRPPLFTGFFKQLEHWEDAEILLKSANPLLAPISFKLLNSKKEANGTQFTVSVRPRDRAILLEKGPEFKVGMGKTRLYEITRSKKSDPAEKKGTDHMDEVVISSESDSESGSEINTEATDDLEAKCDDSYRNVDVTVVERQYSDTYMDELSEEGGQEQVEMSTETAALSDTASNTSHGPEAMDTGGVADEQRESRGID